MDISILPLDKKIVLFDGICNLCNSSIQFIIKHNKKDSFRFVALQSELGQEILQHIGIDTSTIDSIVLYEPGKAYYLKAEAAFKIAEEFDGMYRLLGLFSNFPKFFINYIYDYIAKNRYTWYGKKESCMLPSTELKEKFL